MSAIVDFPYYRDTYKGTEADATSFPTLYAHASRMIGAMARWQVNEDNFSELPSIVQTMYQLAICSQVDFLSVNGLDSVNDSGGGGFTVGKVTVHGSTKSGQSGAMSAFISPAAVMYLEQSGLMNPAVPVVGCCVC